MRALVVEDEVKMAALLRRGLTEEGYAADVAKTGDDALWMARAAPYDVIVLDVMLPGRDGFAVCRELREAGVWAPILMLTAKDAVEDRVEGLDSGADDYLTKPFSFAELLARLSALARRGAAERPPVLQVGSLRLDPATRQVWRGTSRSRSRQRSSRCSRCSCAVQGTCSRGSTCSSTRGTTATRTARTSSTSTFATCGRRSTGRSACARSRRCAAPATACGWTAAREENPDPLAALARVRARDGGRVQRARSIPLRAPRAFAQGRARRDARVASDAQIGSSNELGPAGDEGMRSSLALDGELLASSPSGDDAALDLRGGRPWRSEAPSYVNATAFVCS